MRLRRVGKVSDTYGLNGLVTLMLNPDKWDTESHPLADDMSPDEARLLGLKLIKAADAAEAGE